MTGQPGVPCDRDAECNSGVCAINVTSGLGQCS
jgi:hypothetical protein